jgi:hypothetical protein
MSSSTERLNRDYIDTKLSHIFEPMVTAVIGERPN